MNEIAGLYNLDESPVDRDLIKRMLDEVSSWPADRVGTRYETAVGLGTRQFIVTKEDTMEFLPLQVGAYLLAADARIDNRRQLIRDLSLGSDDTDSSITDSYLILKAYERWGEDCPNRLIGDFAFVIWNAHARRLFCARDVMGIRPFYYCHAPGKFFAFGTTISMVLQGCIGVDTGLNELQLGLIMALDHSDTEITIRKNVLRLPGGHCLSIGANSFSLRRYWELDNIENIRMATDEEYAVGLRKIFFEAVGCRLRSIHPVGAELSGGLDSSSVVCTASQLLNLNSLENPKYLHTYSATFPKISETSKAIDERKYQRAVVEHCNNLIHHPIACDDLDPMHEFLWSCEQPQVTYNSFLDKAMYEAAAGMGVRVMLTGYDGDTAISHGLEYLPALAGTGHWVELCRQCRGMSRPFGLKTSQIIWLYAFKPFWGCLVAVYSTWLRFHKQYERTYPYINREFGRRIGLEDMLWRGRGVTGKFRELFNSRISQISNVTQGIWAYFAESYDSFSRRYRIESRHPFFDRRVIEYSLAIPPRQKLRNGVTRYVMHNAMRGILPEVVNSRMGKANLSACFIRGVERSAKTWLESGSKAQRSTFLFTNEDYCRSAVRQISSDINQSSDAAMNVFCAMVIDRWLNQYLLPES